MEKIRKDKCIQITLKFLAHVELSRVFDNTQLTVLPTHRSGTATAHIKEVDVYQLNLSISTKQLIRELQALLYYLLIVSFFF